MNYFDLITAAERYSKGRPDFHANTIQHVRDYLQLTNKLDKALDIACGTGLSTKALLAIASKVYGTDISEKMLKYAPHSDEIHYSVAPAERQPFPGNFFDLITVSSGVHWFDIERFLAEASRLLKRGSWLVLYENHFIAEMEGHPEFTNWFRDIYLNKFPSPPRNNSYSWTHENLDPQNLYFRAEEKFTNPVRFSRKELALYFTTQSNIIAAVNRKETDYGQVDEWLDQELSRFFDLDDGVRTIYFGNWIKFIQRAG